MNYSTTEFNLTPKEESMVKYFLENNECGAKTAGELLDDNYSCKCIEDLREDLLLSNNEIGGLLSSLQEKNVIYLDDRDGPIYEGTSRIAFMNFEPDLYWISESYLESLDSDAEFY